MTKKKELLDSNGKPLISAAAEKFVGRQVEKFTPEPSALRNEVAAILETQSPAELAATVVELRYRSERLRVVSLLEDAFSTITQVMMDEMGYADPIDLANFVRTPRRAAEAFFDMHPPRWILEQDDDYNLRSRFPSVGTNYRFDSMVVSLDNLAWGLCPHHLLPIRYVIHVAYIPYNNDDDSGGEVLGMSKLVRGALNIACQPIMHEHVAQKIADFLYQPSNGLDENESTDNSLKTSGSIAWVTGQHTCVCARGVRQTSSISSVIVPRGWFVENVSDCKNEFLAIVSRDSRIKIS